MIWTGNCSTGRCIEQDPDMEKATPPPSNVRSVGYDAPSRTLEVKFWNGSIYQYYDVPEDVHKELVRQSAIAQYLRRHIRDQYAHSRVG